MNSDLIDIEKTMQIGSGFEDVHGGRMVAVQTENGNKWLFLPNDLNRNFEDKFYHGYIAGHHNG